MKIEQKYNFKSILHFLDIAKSYFLLNDTNNYMINLNLSLKLYKTETVLKNKIIFLYEYAELCRLSHHYKKAHFACRKVLKWLLSNTEEPDDYQPVAEARLIIGKILVDMQSYQEAVPHLDKARTAFAIGKHYALGETMLYLGKAHLGLGRHAEAENLLISALGEFQRLGLRLKEAEAKRLLGLAP